MFTGIIEETAEIKSISHNGSTTTFTMFCPLAREFKVDQSVSHDGVCLTVTSIIGETYTVDAIAETLSKTTLGKWKVGGTVNLERSLKYQGRLDGHIVQGHVDETVECLSRKDKEGSWDFFFRLTALNKSLVIPRGSVTINGVSLTVADMELDRFKVSIIPYTFEHTTFRTLMAGNMVNIEYDILGKYVTRYLEVAYSNK